MSQKIYAQIIINNNEIEELKINLVLYPDIAPISVKNFVELAKKGYYQGSIFHRVIADFMIQTGGYYLDQNLYLKQLDDIPPIKGEFTSNGWNNDLKHELGVISMARTSDPNSATSQFFLCAATCPWLDKEYAAFGKTTDEKSKEAILKISKIETGRLGSFDDFPISIIRIKEIKISEKAF